MRLVDDFGDTVLSDINSSETGWGRYIEQRNKVIELEHEIKRLKGKIKMLEIMLTAEGNFSRKMVSTALEAIEK
jgi:hypothetical protein